MQEKQMAWLIAIAVLIVLWQTTPRVIQFFVNIKGRKVFNGVRCPGCGRQYDRADVRRSKHLMKTKLFGGPPPAPFSAQVYEAWELRCSACGHMQDFDPAGTPIAFDEPPPGETT